MDRILVLRGGALGDFIVTLPALALLRQQWPAAQIELIGNATAAALARSRGLLDVAHSQHDARWSALFAEGPLPPPLAAWLGAFDLVVNYWPDADGALQRRFPVRAGQRYLAAAAAPACAPAAAHYCAPLRAVGLTMGSPHFRLAPLPGHRLPPSGAAAIVVHPGSGSARKNWPLENWLALIPHLLSPRTLVLGEAEAGRCEQLRHSGLFSAALLAPPLEDLVAHLSSCGLYLGHDSGVSHLAAASGARCVLLFGPTDAAIWAPPAPGVRVVQSGPDLRTLTVAAVRQAAEQALSSRA